MRKKKNETDRQRAGKIRRAFEVTSRECRCKSMSRRAPDDSRRPSRNEPNRNPEHLLVPGSDLNEKKKKN
jgi:hypothetical protein